MDDKERYKQGMSVRRAVLGDEWVDRANAKRNSFTADFQDFITRYAWGETWMRPGLDRRSRSLMTLSMMIALGRWDEFRLHIRAALNNGLTVDEIKEVIMHSAIYAGVPAANSAFAEALEALKACGIDVATDGQVDAPPHA
jgi:4-carboxymuconolactone decarboxylase